MHVHIGSQVFSAENFAEGSLGHHVRTEQGSPSSWSAAGLGCRTWQGRRRPPSPNGPPVGGRCAETGIEAAVAAEPGRSIVAGAAVTAYRWAR